MTICLLENFNNYFNRTLKFYKSASQYIETCNYDIFPNVNFYEADGIKTTHVIGGPYQTVTTRPDYLLVLDDANQIVSRWFVLDSDAQMKGQWRLTLKRDTLADHYDKILVAPSFVEKAAVDLNNPLIYNEEGMTFNQIKKSEHLLKDETGTNWIVGYIDRGTEETTITSVDPGTSAEYTEVEDLNLTFVDPEDPSKGATFLQANGNLKILAKAQGTNALYTDFGDYQYQEFKSSGTIMTADTGSFFIKTNDITGLRRVLPYWATAMRINYPTLYDSLMDFLETKNHSPLTEAEIQRVRDNNGKIVYSARTRKYYRLIVADNATNTSYQDTLTGPSENAMNFIREKFIEELKKDNVPFIDVYQGTPYEVASQLKSYAVTLIETVGPGQREVKISAARNRLMDAPFDMFAIPYSIENLSLANAIALELNAKLYDLQLLPYCPVRKLIGADGIDLTLGTEGRDFDYIKTTGSSPTNLSYILWAITSSDRFTIDYTIAVPTNNIDFKIANETDMYRLVSPNYNGAFEFSACKNNGVDLFIVSYTYKPYTPFIHVAPRFKGLYGAEFNDSRGLLCNGDFSIAVLTDAWKSYELNNKNYQNIFDTQIKTMDVSHRNAMISQGIGGVIGAGTMGAATGLLTGNPWIGVGMGIGSLAGLGADLALSQNTYDTNRKGQIDIYNYNLGNIKARPDTLTKISAYNINNKYFPFVEYYTATDVEKKAFKNKLIYEGMKIMTIGTLEEYLGISNFFFYKARPIILNNIADDSHLSNDIYNELNQGVYIYGPNTTSN